MKTILIASTLSFVAIFGGLWFYAGQQSAEVADTPGSALDPLDVDAAELSFAALEAERAQLARERQQLANVEASLAAREKSLDDQRELLEKAIGDLRSAQQQFGQVRSDNAQKLAKMFDSIKPADGAPILTALDRETALDVLTRMKEKNAAKLLSELEPSLAADLSTRITLRGAR